MEELKRNRENEPSLIDRTGEDVGLDSRECQRRPFQQAGKALEIERVAS